MKPDHLRNWKRAAAPHPVVLSVLAIGNGGPVLAKQVAARDGVQFHTAAARLRSAERQGMLKKEGRKGWVPRTMHFMALNGHPAA